ncbi:MAG TPA: family 43 glycosylhydrolase [Rhizomicrobium sp.]|jgi:xylan 1,4-beta-xylosidase|nr:family 43 glycosylhydrolase [Rhizomicrobium sp.]
MTGLTRRDALGAAALALPALASARGLEGQRQPDLGNGKFLNPVLAGDHPDPSVLRVGGDYYMTFSSFESYPGLVLWHSRDLVSWQPLGPTLFKPVGSVWAPDLVAHAGRFYIYFPARTAERQSIFVIHADGIAGPWSEPVDLGVARIDPGHVVGEDGRRYLFLSGGDRVRLAADGLSADGPVEHVYDGWRYPQSWDVESFSQEGPKMSARDGWFYMTLAEGGTAGPPTGHMVVSARARSIHGPWENSPFNPVVRTRSKAERWWSRGHATLVEAADHSWWLMHHGYENGFWTLGRQALLSPVAWTPDGWFRARPADIAKPLPKPRGVRLPHGLALSDDFTRDAFGTRWSFYDPAPSERLRARLDNGALVLAGKGTAPRDSSPLACVAGDRAYVCEVEIEIGPGAGAGLILFYSRRLYAGLGFDANGLVLHRYGLERRQATPALSGNRLFLRLANDNHIVTLHHSVDGAAWTKFGVQMEVSGYHHNVAGDFLSLRPALYAAGSGEARFRNFRYAAL